MVWSNKLLLASTALVMPEGSIDTVNGGYRAYNNFGDGLLYYLNVAPKSTEVSRLWNNGSTTAIGATPRLDGPGNTDLATIGGVTNNAQIYSKSILFAGSPGYLGALDELRAISNKLRPSAATVSAFQSGGSEVFDAINHWSSNEISGSTGVTVNMTTGAEVNSGKTNLQFFRPIKRIIAPTPYPIGTAMEGGYLAGYFTDVSSGFPSTYMLIVADKSVEVTRTYQNTPSSLGGIYLSRTNGFAPTEANGSTINTAAMNYCFDLVSGGKSDWYLPAIDELLSMYKVNSSLPSGQQISTSTNTWSSTETNSSTAMAIGPAGGTSSPSKTTNYFVRPVRRVLLP